MQTEILVSQNLAQKMNQIPANDESFIFVFVHIEIKRYARADAKGSPPLESRSTPDYRLCLLSVAPRQNDVENITRVHKNLYKSGRLPSKLRNRKTTITMKERRSTYNYSSLEHLRQSLFNADGADLGSVTVSICSCHGYYFW